MRVLFFGTTKGTACSLHYFTALVRLGHDVIPFDPAYFETHGPVEKLMVRARKGPTAAKVQSVSEALIDVCRNSRFDAVFVMSENFLGEDTIETIKRQSEQPPAFLYHSHDNNFSDGILKPPGFFESLGEYDAVFTTKSQNVERYRSLGANSFFVPSAYEPSVHCPVTDEYSRFPIDFDVTFIGTYDGSRPPLLEAVGWDKLRVWGSDWTRWPGYNAHKERIMPRPIYYFEFADVISRSRIALGLLREEAGDLHTQRTFEIPACGTLQIAPRNDEIESFFEDGKEIVLFSSLEELASKVKYFMKHDAERKKIAKRGFDRVTSEKHTYVDRVDTMLKLSGVVKTKASSRRTTGARRAKS
jgi:spore maturation protein CgeB